jgi:UDP-2,3-diacylglucosamine pyrophosphatase LpxH
MGEAKARTIFVISDLHIGGKEGDKERPRGFRMCTQSDALKVFIERLPSLATKDTEIELVINGDFVDFLAEENANKEFIPFVADPNEAERVFLQIVKREKELFLALKKHLQDGHCLTLLLGNHDIELAHPIVMEALIKELGGASARLDVRFDGKPYRIADALIEHGNLYDGFNAITPEEIVVLKRKPSEFRPPPGSRLVAEIMNPLKQAFPFVDLLKPEQEAVFPILMVLAPEKKGLIADLAKFYLEAKKREKKLREQGLETAPASYKSNEDSEDELSRDQALEAVLQEALGPETQEFLDLLQEPEEAQNELVADRTPEEDFAFYSLLAFPRRKALWKALQVIKRDLSFVIAREHDKTYREAAEEHDRSVRWVVMGHTHLAKEHKDIIAGRTYLNTGTWADLVPFPEFVLELPNDAGMAMLDKFLDALKNNQLGDWLAFRPYYARLEFDGNKVTQASLQLFKERSIEPNWRKGG